MPLRPIIALFSVLLVAATVCAQGISPAAKLTVGQRPPVSAVARFSSGAWATSKARSACPVLLNSQAVKVAVYTRDVTPHVVHLMREINKLVAHEPALKWSFVFVSHENDPTPTEEEFNVLIEKLKTIARDELINNLSIGIMERVPESDRPSRRKRELGFVDDGETVVMLIGPSPSDPKSKRAVIQYLETAKSETLTQESVQRIVDALKQASSKAIQSSK